MDRHAAENKIMYKTALYFWDNELLNQSENLIVKAKRNVNHYRQAVFNYGIRNPRNIKEALSLDGYNGNNIWWKEIDKSRANATIYLNLLNIGEIYMPG